MGEFREANGVVLEESDSSVVVVVSDSLSLREEVWAQAEEVTLAIIRQFQPTLVSEDRRKYVIDYVQRLLKFNLGCEVFPFGSVPLKTYLPDGDIDLTAFCGFNMEESFAAEVHSVLEREDHNPHSEFVVKDVQYIRAEVKLVKCLVQNIVVDISFNQIGGLCALCFLEEVDRLIGKDNLFKRSIILIKAWCYYESRILGAHHGLISTYALETLVLYIFHLFHSSLTGPLAVLYKFLDYFSKFDWENYCVSLSGPVNLKSLPEIVAERPENGGGEMLLSDEFMRECVHKFCVPCKGADRNSRTFMRKHFNIVDPLKPNNNLGRSVSKGNFFRIRSAFTYGARKLGQILSQPQDKIAEEIQRFFTNTLDRHGQGQRPDVEDMMVTSGYNGGDTESVYPNNRSSEVTRLGLFSNAFEQETTCVEPASDVRKSNPFKDLLSGDAMELSACGFEYLGITSDADKTSPLTDEKTKLPLDAAASTAPHPIPPSHHRSSNGKLENGDLHENAPSYSVLPKTFPDLSGNVGSHLESLRYGQWWYGCDQFLATFNPVHVGPPLFHRKNQWDATGQSMIFSRPDMVPRVNGVIPRPPFFPPVVAAAGFVDEIPKPRGTGTYFPITNHNSYRDRPWVGRGRNQGQSKSPRTNGRTPTLPPDKNPEEAQSPGRSGPMKPRCADSYATSPRKGKAFKEGNGFVPFSEKGDKFVAQEKPTPALGTPLHEGESNVPSPDPSSPPGSLDGELVFVKDDRLGVQSFRLVDEEDFPPLSA